MPVNLPKEARVKYQRVLEAKTKEEKLRALQEYLSSIPKHKGTENLVAQVRHQIATLKKEIEREKEVKKRITSGPSYNVKKEGDLQYVLIGFTKAGKSLLLNKLTNAKTDFGERPYITTLPIAGTLNYKGVLIQLVDTPSLMKGNDDWNNIIFNLARSADGLVLVLGSKDPVNEFNEIRDILLENGIILGNRRFSLKVYRSPTKKLKLILNGEVIGATEAQLHRMLIDYQFRDVVVEFYGKATMEEFEKALISNVISKPAIVVVRSTEASRHFNFEGLDYIIIPSLDEIKAEEIGKKIFESSGMIRVYTKEPNEEQHSIKPLVVKRGTTAIEIAEIIHRDLARLFKYARVWGKSVNYPGEKVGPKHVLEDGDIIEIRS
ncbi:MAG TPA: TGS domain-containing protein [Geobacterales bacterium]|nr:TGS domain-containing protein [Geobacterales bacterium]